ncbi:hypothetical protein N0V90_002768 [Kalmusia sp. IMI 367209]|nr:hypothetical protein N0V90_002768 [Kalmusia sp. IMI 367209]
MDDGGGCESADEKKDDEDAASEKGGDTEGLINDAIQSCGGDEKGSEGDVFNDAAHAESWLDGEGDKDYLPEDSESEEMFKLESDDDTEDGDPMDIDSDPDAEGEDDMYAKLKSTNISFVPTRDAFTNYLVSLTKEPPPEHNCFRGTGYDGAVITAEEMLNCTTAQCILSRAHHEGAMEDEDDDLDFERGSRYCLSGLCGHVRSRDCGGEIITPARHSVGAPIVDSMLWVTGGDNYTAIPFHPTCFDIFTRLSRQRFGYINFEALGMYCFAEGDYDIVINVSSDENVRNSSQQWWSHDAGCEYLAANPLFIPRLTPILRDAIQHDTEFDPQTGAFDVPPYRGEGDLFNSLPLELRLQTLSYLSSRDIANLRLASRTFRQLPVLLWRDLLLAEMPYLWEVWSDDEPYIWATVTHDAVMEHENQESEIQTRLNDTRNIIKEEYPKIIDEWEVEVKGILSKRQGFLEAGRADALRKMVTGLPVANTNWYKLYAEITKNWADLKGLKNRKRIWMDVGGIVEKLDKYTHVS